MPKTGRPRALDEHKLTAICAVVSQGGSIEEAAQLVGCAPSTIYREKRRNERFRKELHEAQVEATLTPYRRMNAASRRSWRAASWMVEHNKPRPEHSTCSQPLRPESRRPPARQPRQSILDGPIDPATAEWGVYIFDRLVESLKERWGMNQPDRQTPSEVPSPGAAAPFATPE